MEERPGYGCLWTIIWPNSSGPLGRQQHVGIGRCHKGDGKCYPVLWSFCQRRRAYRRSIRRHASNKGNRRRRFLLTDADETAGTDAFFERSGPPTIDYPYHRDNYYMLEAYLPNRSWSGDAKRWLYVPADQHARDVAHIMAGRSSPHEQPRG